MKKFGFIWITIFILGALGVFALIGTIVNDDTISIWFSAITINWERILFKVAFGFFAATAFFAIIVTPVIFIRSAPAVYLSKVFLSIGSLFLFVGGALALIITFNYMVHDNASIGWSKWSNLTKFYNVINISHGALTPLIWFIPATIGLAGIPLTLIQRNSKR